MNHCSVCGAQIDPVSGYVCDRCSGHFCSDHRLPENHDCGAVVSSDTSSFVERAGSVVLGDGGEEADADAGRRAGGASPSSAPSRSRGPSKGSLVIKWRRIRRRIRSVRRRLPSRRSVSVMLFVVAVAAVSPLGVGVVTIDDVRDSPAGPIVSSVEDAADEYDGDRELDTAEAERLIHEEVNERRQEHGIAELHYHEGLEDDAQEHSQDMSRRGFYAHENPEGDGPQERTTTRCRVGENINKIRWGDRYETPTGDVVTLESEHDLAEQVVDEWMNSPGHRENILDGRYASEGIGVAIDGDEVYVTQMFCL